LQTGRQASPQPARNKSPGAYAIANLPAAPIFSGNRQIFFEAATEVSDIEKIACIMQKMFLIQATMFLSNEKIILNMGTIFPIMEKII
jgi:hypothetical protein